MMYTLPPNAMPLIVVVLAAFVVFRVLDRLVHVFNDQSIRGISRFVLACGGVGTAVIATVAARWAMGMLG